MVNVYVKNIMHISSERCYFLKCLKGRGFPVMELHNVLALL